jgi:hypothetical protein
MDSTAQTAAVALEFIYETASKGDAWIRQRKESMWAQKSSTKTESLPTQKSSTKLLPQETHGFDSPNSPCGLSSLKLLPRVTHGFDSANSPSELRNDQRNCFHGRRMDLTVQTAHMDLEIINEN